ncbi:MAG: efflux RND transporter periplasmic adaptor subunit [Gammaproteobacteria bacterium]|nr:efflux RND transporter periplasmic adaptor subunit [Gammaproteobacteria bacterium]
MNQTTRNPHHQCLPAHPDCARQALRITAQPPRLWPVPWHWLWLVLLTAATAGAAELAPQLPLSTAQRDNLGLQFASPEATSMAYSAYYPARVTVPNSQRVTLAAPLAGVITSLSHSPGASVSQGQLLVLMHSPELTRLQQDWLSAEAERQLATTAHERDRQLLAEGIIPAQRVQASQRDLRTAQAAAQRAWSALRMAGMAPAAIKQLQADQQLDGELRLPAPLSGTVLTQHVDTGARVSQGDAIYTLLASDQLLLEIHAASSECAQFSPGQPVSLQDSQASASLIEVSCVVHEADQGILLRARIDEGAASLRPGQMVRASIGSAISEPTWSVPPGAVVRLQNQTFVFVDQTTHIELLAVSIKHAAPDRLHVAGALDASSRIVVVGTAALKGLWTGIGAE